MSGRVRPRRWHTFAIALLVTGVCVRAGLSALTASGEAKPLQVDDAWGTL
jgi:hypothetical protein